MKGLTNWCKAHRKAYIMIVYGVGLAIGFGLGYQVCLEIHSLGSRSVGVFV